LAKIGINQLCEGMIVEDTVTDLRGTILLQKGTVITHNGIKILKTWGILEISIDEQSAAVHSISQESHVDARIMMEAAAKAETLFQHADRNNIFVKELIRLATNRIAMSWTEGG